MSGENTDKIPSINIKLMKVKRLEIFDLLQN